MSTTPRDAESQAYLRALSTLQKFSDANGLPSFDSSGSRSLEAWFLGPKAENAELLEHLVSEAVRDQAFWRRNYHPSDPTHITETVRRSPEFLEATDTLKESYYELLAFLKKSVPFFSMRYQGHMNWDLTLPGILGYFAAMLYNPNNVAFEGSTATTLLEILVGDDLCRMLGFDIPDADDVERGAIRPWGHITCDGTVANIEAIWSARNLKFYPIALREALNNDERLSGAKSLTVRLSTDEVVALADVTETWPLMNIRADDILALPTRLSLEFDISRDVLSDSLKKYSLQSLGFLEFSRQLLRDTTAPVFFVPGTKHYSFPKAAALLGLGAANMIDVPLDLDTRMNVEALRELLDKCLEEQRPVISVVCVIGSTEESSIDPIADVLELRDAYRKRGLEFTVHADGAWGGYHASVIRDDFDMPEPVGFAPAPPPAVPLKAYVQEQFAALGEADSITVDPHKSGYIPYPAGALCYRNSAMRDLVTFSAPVVFHGDAEPTVGIYGIEGSKPGAAAAAVYLSHRVIRPSKSGYGKIIGQALYSCRKYYARLLSMSRQDDPFIVVPVARLPAEIDGGDVEAQLEFIRERIDGRSNNEILADNEALALLAEIGPDENILAYAINFRHTDGTLNQELDLANKLNKALYNRLSIDPGQDIYGYDFIVSTTDLDVEHYDRPFIDDYKRRLGVSESSGDKITVLRSVIMDPWLTETKKGSFIDVLEKELRKAISGALEELIPTITRGY